MTRNKLFFPFILLILCLAGCGVGSKSLKKPYDWIPNDFNYAANTLLIEKHPYSNQMSIKLDRFFKKRYKWDFIVTTEDSILKKLGPYSDTQKYPYALLWTDSRSVNTRVGHTETIGSSAGYYNMDGNFYNRKTDSSYRNAPGTGDLSAQTYKAVANTLKKRWK